MAKGHNCNPKHLWEVLNKETKFSESVKNSHVFGKPVKEGVGATYEPTTDKKRLASAKQRIKRDAEGVYDSVLAANDMDSQTVIDAQMLALKYQAEGKYNKAVHVLDHISTKLSEAGQYVQAASVFGRLTPEGALRYATQMLEGSNAKRGGAKKAKQLKALADEVDEVVKAKELTDKQKAAKLKLLLGPVAGRQQRSMTARILELNKLGAFDKAAYRQMVAEKLGLATLDEAAAKEITELAKAVQASKTKNDYTVNAARLMARIGELQPSSVGQKVATVQTMGQLLNPKTAIRNIVGNAIFGAVDTGSNAFAAALDRGVALFTGHRSIVMPQTKMMGRGFKQGFDEGVRDAIEGIDTSGLASKYDLPKKRVFKNKVMRSLETALDIELRATDRAFYQMAYRESLLNQVKAAKGSKNAPARVRITDEMTAIAHQEALYKTFQDDSAAATVFKGLKRALNIGQDFGLGDFVLKYPKTPANLLSRAFAYSPTGIFKTLHLAIEPMLTKGAFNQRAFVQSFSRATIGTVGVVGMGHLLGSLGIATGGYTKDPDIRAAERLKGEGEYRINASALMRFVMSGFNPESAKKQTGDQIFSYDWAQPMAIPLAAGVELTKKHKGKTEKALDTITEVGRSTVAGADALTQQGLLRGLQDLFEGRDYEGKPSPAMGLLNVMASAPSSFSPTIASQLNQLVDNTQRDTYDPNIAKQAINKTISKIPGLAQTLPERKDAYGRTAERYQDGSNNMFNVFLNPAFVSTIKKDPLNDEVLRIFEDSGMTTQAARVAPHRITIKRNGKSEKIELTGQQVSEYQQFIGTNTSYALNRLIRFPGYRSLSDEGKAQVMGAIVSDINTAAKMKLHGHESSQRPSFVTIGAAKGNKLFIKMGTVMRLVNEVKNQVRSKTRPAFKVR